MMRWMIIATVVAIVLLEPSVMTLAATNETVTVQQAKPKDNPQSTPADIEGYFQDPPNANKDEIHVTQQNVTGQGTGVYNDPVNDGALLTITQQSGPVKVDVEGREGIGAMYWVTVLPVTSPGGSGHTVILWADVKDMNEPGALVLKDTTTGAGTADHADTTNDTPTLYCTAPLPAGTGSIELRLNADSGTYDWVLQVGQTPVYWGTLESGNSYLATQAGISPGVYSVVVTSRNDPTFLRVINCSPIEIGQYLPTTYPEEEIPVYSAGENTPYSYYDGGGQIRSITVGAPIDGDEGASNPYSYDTNYTITINPNNGTATVSLDLPGVYMLRIERDYGGQYVATYQTLSVCTDFAAYTPPSTEWPIVLILAPHWDYNLIFQSADLQKGYNGITLHPKDWFASWSAGQGSVETLVGAKYTALGNAAFTLTMMAHGHLNGGKASADQWIDKNNVANVLGSKIANKITRVRCYVCRAGRLPDGSDFLQNLKTSSNATETSGYVSDVGVSGWPYFWVAGQWGNKTVK